VRRSEATRPKWLSGLATILGRTSARALLVTSRTSACISRFGRKLAGQACTQSRSSRDVVTGAGALAGQANSRLPENRKREVA
jgi:hypothetical protein